MSNTNKDQKDGEVIDSITTSDETVVKTSKVSKPTYRQRKFANAYKEGDTMGNATKSALKAGYSEVSAYSQGSTLLKNPKVLAILNESVEEAERVIRSLMYDESSAIALAASKEVLDRTQGKSIARSENINVNISVEDMLGSS